MTRIVVHGHFYQPPREDPWTNRIERQPSAAPFPDWNERIYAECYRPNAFATVPTEIGELTVNNFERLSFDVGPTLMSWLERAHPETYARIIEADRRSEARLGAGNAIAQSFHHSILPLASPRDVRTEIRWGLADFRYRFNRPARGMWLPETAANDDVLSALIEENVSGTILAPHQADRWREGDGQWVDTEKTPIDPRLPYRYLHRDGSGRSLTVFFFDPTIAKSIAFENAASSALGFLDLFQSRAGDAGVVTTATDGETFGHHFRFADLGLAYALFVEAENHAIQPVNYAVLLEEGGPPREVRVVGGEGTSWSCDHGVGRWTRDCGCAAGAEEGWNQAWREPLRAALDLIRHAGDEVYERLGATLLKDAWQARDAYVDVVIGKQSIEEFLAAHASGPMSDGESAQASALLEMQRNCLAMYTSCGWFFADISGIETKQILRYAARALELMESLGQPTPAEAVVAKLEEAKSNVPEEGTGADVFSGLH